MNFFQFSVSLISNIKKRTFIFICFGGLNNVIRYKSIFLFIDYFH